MNNQEFFNMFQEAGKMTFPDFIEKYKGVSDAPEFWFAAHRNIKSIAKKAGISLRQLGFKCGIPRRTIENWSTGTRECPPYVIMLIQQYLGVFDVKTYLE